MGLVLIAATSAACTTAASGGADTYDSVRERLAAGPTRLFVGREASAGLVTARRWTPGGWVEGDTPLAIASGELAASVDASGALTVKTFEVDVAPIEIPEDVFKKPAQLTDVRVLLAAPASAPATWTSDDDATATIPMTLDLEWTIAINGGKTPLGSQHLPPVDIALALGGDGDVIDATAALAADGEIWNWAGLLKMTHLEMTLGAETVH